MRSFHPLVSWISPASVVACVMFLPYWAMAAPIQANATAREIRGWEIVFVMLVLYCIACALNTLPFWMFRGLVSEARRQKWQIVHQNIAMVLMMLTSAFMVYALVLLSA